MARMDDRAALIDILATVVSYALFDESQGIITMGEALYGIAETLRDAGLLEFQGIPIARTVNGMTELAQGFQLSDDGILQLREAGWRVEDTRR